MSLVTVQISVFNKKQQRLLLNWHNWYCFSDRYNIAVIPEPHQVTAVVTHAKRRVPIFGYTMRGLLNFG